MHGATLRAAANKFLTRDAPMPTNISVNSVAATEKNGTPASPATQRANNVFPVPGGPLSKIPPGTAAPTSLNFWKSLKNRINSYISSFKASIPAISSKDVFRFSIEDFSGEYCLA